MEFYNIFIIPLSVVWAEFELPKASRLTFLRCLSERLALSRTVQSPEKIKIAAVLVMIL